MAKYKKSDIAKLERLQKEADKAHLRHMSAIGSLAEHIIDMFGVNGYAGYLKGDGHRFTPISNDDTYVTIDALIDASKIGIEVDEEWMLGNTTI